MLARHTLMGMLKPRSRQPPTQPPAACRLPQPQGLLKAFNLHGDDDSAAAAPAPAAASAAAAAAGPAISVEGVEEVAADAAPAEAAAQEAGVAPEEQVGIELLQVGEDAQDAEIEGEFTDDAELEMPESV